MADWDPQAWSPMARAFYALGFLYLLGFFVFFALFLSAEAKAKTGNPAAIARYNRLVRGFPNAFYAKMLGRRPLEVRADTKEAPARPGGAPPPPG